jgi:hypothetical protein
VRIVQKAAFGRPSCVGRQILEAAEKEVSVKNGPNGPDVRLYQVIP